VNVSVRVVGADKVHAQMLAIQAGLRSGAFAAAMLAGAKLIEAEAKRQAPVKTGTLSRSITTELAESSETHVLVEIGTNLVYAAVQEFGGTITARNAPYLVFQTDDGQWHSVRSVTIPAHPYLRPAADIAGPLAIAFVAGEITKLLEVA